MTAIDHESVPVLSDERLFLPFHHTRELTQMRILLSVLCPMSILYVVLYPAVLIINAIALARPGGLMLAMN
jgi:hypothetical protein